jgi:hypothetical protein
VSQVGDLICVLIADPLQIQILEPNSNVLTIVDLVEFFPLMKHPLSLYQYKDGNNPIVLTILNPNDQYRVLSWLFLLFNFLLTTLRFEGRRGWECTFLFTAFCWSWTWS